VHDEGDSEPLWEKRREEIERIFYEQHGMQEGSAENDR
jgi:hypothetical protein